MARYWVPSKLTGSTEKASTEAFSKLLAKICTGALAVTRIDLPLSTTFGVGTRVSPVSTTSRPPAGIVCGAPPAITTCVPEGPVMWSSRRPDEAMRLGLNSTQKSWPARVGDAHSTPSRMPSLSSSRSMASRKPSSSLSPMTFCSISP